MEANETTETIAVGKKNSPLEVSSRIISGIFTPFMIPFVAFFLLFFFTYLRYSIRAEYLLYNGSTSPSLFVRKTTK